MTLVDPRRAGLESALRYWLLPLECFERVITAQQIYTQRETPLLIKQIYIQF